MKDRATETEFDDSDTMRSEYDFSGATRGVTAARYAEGSNVVVIEVDVRDVFPNAASVNEALRALAPLLRRQPDNKGQGRIPVTYHDPLDRLRELCLDLPEATEKETWGDPTFRVRDKIFAMPKVGDGRFSVWCKAPPGVQGMLVDADPERFFVPPYVGHNGWIGVRLDVKIDWDELSDLLEESYRMTAPERLLALLDHG